MKNIKEKRKVRLFSGIIVVCLVNRRVHTHTHKHTVWAGVTQSNFRTLKMESQNLHVTSHRLLYRKS